MFARLVQMKLKSDSAEFTRMLENDVIPVLRRQHGFRDEIALVSPSGKEAVAISLWDDKQSADAYNRNVYPDVLKILERSVSGSPQAQSFDVSNSTFHNISARKAA